MPRVCRAKATDPLLRPSKRPAALSVIVPSMATSSGFQARCLQKAGIPSFMRLATTLSFDRPICFASFSSVIVPMSAIHSGFHLCNLLHFAIPQDLRTLATVWRDMPINLPSWTSGMVPSNARFSGVQLATSLQPGRTQPGMPSCLLANTT